jgi:3' terminal RNA ribose 2'-O-methyltransferase Hen1
MLLTISLTRSADAPATDLGYLLHKHPGRLQSFGMSYGQAHVFYPEASEERCTAALLLDVDPVALVRGRASAGGGSSEGGTLEQYVNDRPYVASSFLSVALTQVYGSALNGRSRERATLTETPLPLEARLAVLPSRGGEAYLRRLFEPLGYAVTTESFPLDERFPEWGASPYFAVTLRAAEGGVRLKELLSHLYVLIPVLDDYKHYWIADDELEKLLRHGASWLAAHPERETITRRYLPFRRDLAREALTRLTVEDAADPDEARERQDTEEEAVEKPLSLNEQRLAAVVGALKEVEAQRVVDLGCGEGRLLRMLLDDRGFTEIVGLDVSYRALEQAKRRLRLDRLPPAQAARISLLHGALTYRDRRIEGYDAATVVEVIEHLDPPRFAAFERVLFEFARPAAVVLTTPNVEYNVRFPGMPAGALRHRDHRFEWTRDELRAWAGGVAARYGYAVELRPVGPEDPLVGAPTQLALFRREG